MGIKVEFNPDLALRNIEEFRAGRRQEAECIPEGLKVGETYEFLKKDQRLYWLHGEIPLLETKGEENLSAPTASIIILEVTHYVESGTVWTKGKYKVIEVISNNEVRFNGFAKI